MGRITAILSSTLLLCCCTRAGVDNAPERPLPVAMKVYAEVSKTVLSGGYDVHWEQGDSIVIFDSEGGRKFIADNSGATATFSGSAIENDVKYMLYPYRSNAKMVSPGVIRTLVPGSQKARVSSFGAGNNVTVAKLDDKTFYALNVCSVLKLRIDRSDVKTVTFASRDAGKILSGYTDISIPNSGYPTASISSGSGSVSLIPAEGDTLAPGTYYIDALPCVLSSGYRLRVTTDSATMDKVVETPSTLVRGTIFDLGTIDDSFTYSQDSSTGPYLINAKEQGKTSWTMTNLTYTVNDIPGFSPDGEPELDEYGGWKGVFTFPATGWFYCAKHEGRWWMVDPIGNPFISKGICGFRLDLGSETARNAFSSKYSNSYELWAKGEWEMLKGYGFNSFGSFSNYSKIKQHLRTPYSVLVTIASSWAKECRKNGAYSSLEESEWKSEGPYGIPMVFEDGWAEFVDKTIKATASSYASDPYVMGYMTDNELPAENIFLKYCMNCFGPGDRYYDVASSWLEEKGYAYKDVKSNTDVQRQFAAFVYETYLSAVSGAFRKYAPNQMYMGTKMTGRNNGLANKYIFRVSGLYCDAVSVDMYHCWSAENDWINMWESESHKPVILAEWYVKGEDSGLANTSGVGWTVPTQTDRGRFYQHYCITGLSTGKVVGWHWFRYMDNDPDADSSDNPSNVDANKGVVTVTMNRYTDFLDQMKMLNDNVFPLCEFYSK